MRRHFVLVVIALTCAAAVSACTSGSAETAAPGTVITLDPDPGPGNETFTVVPLPDEMLSAQEALSKFQSRDKEFQPPDDATYTFGLYTARIDSDTYRFNNKPAWAITYHLCAAFRHPGTNTNIRVPCTRWVLLNARTGNLLEGTWSP